MILHFNKKHWLLLVAGLIFVGLAFAGFYYFQLTPMTKKAAELTTNLQTEEKILASYENKLKLPESKLSQNSTDLQKKVPVKPIVEQFLLDLEKAEAVSNSLIVSMSFEESDMTAEQENNPGNTTNQEQQSEAAGQAGGAEQTQKGNNANETASQNGTPPASLPPGLKRLTVNLTVESPDYYAMEAFLQTIEDLERITKIDSLSFTGPEEKTSLEEKEEDKKLKYTLTISTFYHPGLKDLYEDVPPFETPEPSNKKNPLTKAGIVNEEENDKKEESAETTNERSVGNSPVSVNKKQVNQVNGEVNQKQVTEKNTEETTTEQLLTSKKTQTETTENSNAEKSSTPSKKIIKHQVKVGDSLYKISMTYYKSNKGIELIQKQNGLKGNEIKVGQVLEIPIGE